MEVIDGQQRLTTLMLLLRAFYSKFGHMQDKASISTKQNIEKCLWKTDEFGDPNMRDLKIDSDVATDNDKDQFLEILRTGKVKKGQKSLYAQNFQFFQNCIDSFLDKFPSYFAYLPTRIMNNCILLPIEAESQDTALRIFSTLNDRGKPLSDADIFKAQFYKFFSSIGKKDNFINRWKELEELCEKIFHPISGTPMDELFTRYMYFVRAKMGIKSSTTDALRKFYEKDSYILLRNEETFEDLVVLADFWNEVSNQDKDRFSTSILRKLFVLNYAPNSMWTYFVSVYFMQNRDEDGNLEETAFAEFLDKITGFIWTYAATNPGVNALRTPVYAEMVNIVNNQPVTFADYRFDADKVRSMLNNFSFNNGRPITKAMLTWWAFTDEHQELLSLENVYEIVVLAGDLLKTFVPCLLCRIILFSELGAIAAAYAGLGAMLGHNFPVWHRLKGGKGVACTCAALVSVSFGYGLLACIVGLIGVLISHYLPIGAVLIPVAFLIPAFCFFGNEAGILSVILSLVML